MISNAHVQCETFAETFAAGSHRRYTDRMEYASVMEGLFLQRLNRFAADVSVDGVTTRCHVKNSGRLQELLTPGAVVWIDHQPKDGRKTSWDLIAVKTGDEIVNIDSQAPNRVFHEFLQEGSLIENIIGIKPEAVYGTSRFDFFVESINRKIYIEVKGVTLVENGAALFPDAPTARGVKHLRELSEAAGEGYETCIFFLIQRKDAVLFRPNEKTHPAFAEALKDARDSAVTVLAWDSIVTKESIMIGDRLPVYI